MSVYKSAFLVGLSLALVMGGAAEGAPFLPSGLTPGSQYHLAFVTQGQRDGSSPLISAYDTFVNTQAALNPGPTGTNVGVTYFAIASTTAIDARAHAIVSAPVYNFSGVKVADNFADMWDGTLDAAVLVDQFGAGGFPDMYTGSDLNGLMKVGNEMGSANPQTGLSNFSSSRWIDDTTVPNNVPYSFYALSQPITVPTTLVPEPTSLALWMLLGATGGLALHRRRRRR